MTGPLDLYAELIGTRVSRTLNATTRRTRRESLLEVFLIAVDMEAGNGGLRIPRALLDQADAARRAGRVHVVRFDPVTFEYVLTLPPPAQAGQLDLGQVAT